MLKACLFTVIIETCLFLTFGYRDRYSVEIIVLANVATNLSLNLLRWLFPALRGPLTVLLECFVVIIEYFIYRDSFGPSKRLFFITLAANAITYLSSFIVF